MPNGIPKRTYRCSVPASLDVSFVCYIFFHFSCSDFSVSCNVSTFYWEGCSSVLVLSIRFLFSLWFKVACSTIKFPCGAGSCEAVLWVCALLFPSLLSLSLFVNFLLVFYFCFYVGFKRILMSGVMSPQFNFVGWQINYCRLMSTIIVVILRRTVTILLCVRCSYEIPEKFSKCLYTLKSNL